MHELNKKRSKGKLTESERRERADIKEKYHFSQELDVEQDGKVRDLTEDQQAALSATQEAVRTAVREELDRMGKEYGWIKAGEIPAREVRIPRKTEVLPIFKGKGKSESIAAPAPVSSVGFVDCLPYTQGQVRQRVENVVQCGIIHANKSRCKVLGVGFGHRTIFIHCVDHKAKNGIKIVQLNMYALQINHARSPPLVSLP